MASTPPAADASALVPDTAVGVQVTWVLAAVAQDAAPTAAEIGARLGEVAAAQITPEQVLAAFDQVRAMGPWEVTAYDGDETTGRAALRSGGGELLDLVVALDTDGLVETLLFQPGYEHVPAADWDELAAALTALPATTTLLVSDVSDPAAPIETAAVGDVTAAHPIASVVKLYVLGAVVAAVEAGDLTWDDEVTVTDALRSLPSGELQDAPAGTTVTVREAAGSMIAISDNTATDLLIDAVGRERVEAQVAAMGHHDPAALAPLASTRELFWIGWGDDGSRREAWRDGDEAARRAILADLPAGPPDLAAVTGEEAVWPDGVDWFASAADIVAAHEWLARAGGTPAGEPLAEILGTNPGVSPQAAAQWSRVAFKGGSSTGVLALTWRVEGDAGSFVVVLLASAPAGTATADVRPYAGYGEDALRLAGGAGGADDV